MVEWMLTDAVSVCADCSPARCSLRRSNAERPPTVSAQVAFSFLPGMNYWDAGLPAPESAQLHGGRPAEQCQDSPYQQRHAATKVKREKEVECERIVFAVRSVGAQQAGRPGRQFARHVSAPRSDQQPGADQDEKE